MAELAVLSHQFQVVYDDEDLAWVMVQDFPLPRGFEPNQAEVLLFLPPGYPLVPPLGWAIGTRNGALAKFGRSIQTSDEKGWAYFVLDETSWYATADLASGDGLHTVLERIARQLGRM
ncbi:hypothetical protein HYR54_15255 [Candidatus Acetothermia bacterium]|nr:hypothetical protein [Candidatus Acetothermia bacterium]